MSASLGYNYSTTAGICWAEMPVPMRATPSIVSAVAELEWATVDNAKALQLEDKIGSLTPGKQADILLLNTDQLNVLPANDPIQCIVFNANRSNVDTVFVAGRKMKEGGRLTLDAGDLARRKQQLVDSGQWLLTQAGLL